MTSLVPLIRRHTLGDWIYDFDRMFERSSFDQNVFQIRGDIAETDKHIAMSFDLPGMKEEDLNVQVKENLLIISGERKREDDENGKYKYVGRSYGKFSKKYSLPENIDKASIEADYKNGVLTLTLPKSEPDPPSLIDVKINKK